nr:hypothetical protein GCM10017745_30840 [Saccharothrix mutabilis subsp. capreolus]
MARLELDHAGIAEVLVSDGFRAATLQAAVEVAAVARARGLRTEDGAPLPVGGARGAGHRPGGCVGGDSARRRVGMEARHGVLRRAAEQVGLDPHGLDGEDSR